MKTIGILGSTGSIGTQTLDVVRANGDISVKAIAAGSNISRLSAASGTKKRQRTWPCGSGIRIQRSFPAWTASWRSRPWTDMRSW